ncbi:MAG TPA: APC family permease [Bacteroidota bacterium]|nr:APC family permease [Bacteroidota bacterium]
MFTLHFFITLAINILVLGIFGYLLKTKDLLAYFSNGKWWLTWLAIGIITLMDELTSIFYAPSESFRFIGYNAIAFLILTSVLIRFLSMRMIEIAQILEVNGIRGGGVYSFSYLVLGPTVSFIAVSSIIVDYVLTASISTVSAVENGMSFLPMSEFGKFMFEGAIIWFIAGLNIIGIKENAKFTYGIFIVASIVLINLLAAGVFHADAHTASTIAGSFTDLGHTLLSGSFFNGYFFVIVGVSSCILAYSGIESVVQTASLVKSWKEIRKAYTFLALTVGIFTPAIAAVVLSSHVNFAEHETDLITHFARTVGGSPFGYIVGILASILLMMAVNTAYVASSELMERVAHHYGFTWIIKTNKRQSLYRLHIGNAIFYTIIIYITGGSQRILAEMYAIGLLASFAINMGSLLIYRYSKGTTESLDYTTSRIGTLILFLILFSCFLYLGYHKPYGTLMWTTVTAVFLFVGLRYAEKRAPEKKEIQQTDTPLQMIFHLVESDADDVHIYFRRPKEHMRELPHSSSVYISLYHPRQGISPKMAPNHFRFAYQRQTLFQAITEILYAIEYELPHKNITIHLGWPTSSWLDRLSTGVMIFSLTHLPKYFPRLNFVMEYFGRGEEAHAHQMAPLAEASALPDLPV